MGLHTVQEGDTAGDVRPEGQRVEDGRKTVGIGGRIVEDGQRTVGTDGRIVEMDKRRWGIGKDCGGWMEDGGKRGTDW